MRAGESHPTAVKTSFRLLPDQVKTEARKIRLLVIYETIDKSEPKPTGLACSGIGARILVF